MAVFSNRYKNERYGKPDCPNSSRAREPFRFVVADLPDVTAAAALRRLLDLARGDTGQCRLIANFLLAWWNAPGCGGWDLADLWAVDDAIARDMLSVAAFIAANHEYPDTYGLGAEFEALVKQWRPNN